MRLTRISLCLLTALLCLAGLGAETESPVIKPKSSASKVAKSDPRTIAALMHQGEEALAAEDYHAARDAFVDVISLDPGNLRAQAGASLAHLHLGDYPRARDELEKTLTATPIPTRSQAVNSAAIYVRMHNPMRAAKFLKEYLSKASQPDEPALNALAAALGEADDQARRNKLFAECVTFYDSENAKLEATRPGMKRWGTQWLSASEADRKQAEWKRVLGEADRISAQISTLQRDLSAAQRELTRRLSLVRHGYASQSYASQEQGEVNRIDAQIADAAKRREEVLAKGERPPLPKSVEPVALEIIAPVAVASSGAGAGPPPAHHPEEVAVNPPPPVPQPSEPGEKPSPAETPPPPPQEAPPAEAPRRRTTTYGAAFPVASDLLVTMAAAVPEGSKVEIQNADGAAFDAEVVRSDSDSGLTLLRVSGVKLNYLTLASSFSGGPVSCISFPVPNVFQPTAETVAGSAVAPRAQWTVRLNRSPRLGGGPLMSGGRVIGVELATRDSDLGAIPAATLDDLKKLLGSDLPAGGGVNDGASVIMQVSAVHEK